MYSDLKRNRGVAKNGATGSWYFTGIVRLPTFLSSKRLVIRPTTRAAFEQAGLFKMEGWPILIHNPYRKATRKGTLRNPRGLRIAFEQPRQAETEKPRPRALRRRGRSTDRQRQSKSPLELPLEPTGCDGEMDAGLGFEKRGGGVADGLF